VRIGQGFDVHRLVPDHKLMLGGLEIPAEETGGFGLEGHSDGDVLLHAVADALLGALGEGDLGSHFPSSDPALRGIASARILERVVAMTAARELSIVNLDVTIIAQVPRLAPHQAKIRSNLAGLLDTPEQRVNVKVTSTDRLGALGREEGIAALAAVLLEASSATAAGG
jgi:2-C-methyl-D-erythritol 2,4-cyclodiphosphate synthase